MRAYRRKKAAKDVRGTVRLGGGIQISPTFDAETMARLNRLAARNELTVSTTVRELTRTALSLAESGEPWRRPN